MLKNRRAGVAERTAAPPAEPPAAALRAEDISARRRGRVRDYLFNHPRIMDLVVVAAFLLLGFGAFVSLAVQSSWSPLVVLLASCVVLLFRRDRPLTVLVILSVFEIINISLAPAMTNIGASVWFALYAVAVTRRPVISFILAPVAGLPLVLFMLFMYQYPEEFLTENGPGAQASAVISCVVFLVSNFIAVAIGASVRRSRLHEAELQQWAERHGQLASVAERNRIAREMHDVVAHSLTVMVALSDGAAVVLKRDPRQAGEVLGQLSHTGRTALADMRKVLGVLRQDGTPQGPRAPQPDHMDSRTLVEGFRRAGLPIVVSHRGPLLDADSTLELTIYRIIQESLTNVLRYGTAVSRVEVTVHNEPDVGTLRVRIVDDGHGRVNPSLGTGQGIAGMRERAGLFGGTVTAGPQPGGGWAVEALLHPPTGCP